jgi:hypothetical protein
MYGPYILEFFDVLVPLPIFFHTKTQMPLLPERLKMKKEINENCFVLISSRLIPYKTFGLLQGNSKIAQLLPLVPTTMIDLMIFVLK